MGFVDVNMLGALRQKRVIEHDRSRQEDAQIVKAGGMAFVDSHYICKSFHGSFPARDPLRQSVNAFVQAQTKRPKLSAA